MKTLLACAAAALATTGCTISTELSPEGSKYSQAARGTGSNIANRFDARAMPATKVLGNDEVERLLRPGGSAQRPGQN